MLNLSGKIDQGTLELLALIHRVTLEMGVEYLVIGATARDLVMHYGYGARIQRATHDLDFAIQIEGWDSFDEIKDRLIANGFKDGKSLQRVVSPAGMPVDIVPFGGIADKNSNIQWPPSGDVEMDVAGFQEAHQSAIQVLIQQDPPIQIPVASPQGLALLKIIAWDGSKSATRAVHDALPLLKMMEKVIILIVDADKVEHYAASQPGEELSRHLSIHGVNNEISRVLKAEVSTSTIILNELSDSGADILIMGGYGTPKLREVMLGGVTRTLFECMTVPVFMSH